MPKRTMQCLQRMLGITAIELLIIIAALGLVLLISIPASSVLLEKYRMNAATTDLVEGLNLARSEAMRRGSTVRVCPSSTGRDCRRDADWSQGWLVFTDGNGDGRAQEIELIEFFEGPEAAVRVIALGAVQDAAAFTLTGLLPTGDEQSTGEFVICYDREGSTSRTILIDADGWVRRADSNGVECTAG